MFELQSLKLSLFSVEGMELSKLIRSWDPRTWNHANTFCQVGAHQKLLVLVLLLLRLNKTTEYDSREK